MKCSVEVEMKVIPKSGESDSSNEKAGNKLSLLKVAVLTFSAMFAMAASSKTLIFESNERKSATQSVASDSSPRINVSNCYFLSIS